VKTLTALSVLAAIIFTACTKEPQDIETIQPNKDLYIEVTDTIKPSFTVYRLDSFATSGSNTAIIGSATDPWFGRLESQSFCRFRLATNYYETVGAANEYYDSIVLILHADSSYYGDTSSLWQIKLQALRQEFDASRTVYYNDESLLSYEQELGSAALKFRPHIDDSVRIRLNDTFGSELFDFYKNRDGRIKNEENFQRYFRGLRITSAAGNEVIYRFGASDSTMFIRLYYHEDQGTPVAKYLDFASQGGTYQFNNITCDVSASSLQQLLPGEEIPSENLANRIFVNDLAGIGTKITFPSATSLPALPNFTRLADAVLNLRPIEYSFERFPLIGYLGIGLTSEESATTLPLYSSDNSYIQNGNLHIDLLNGTETKYTYDFGALLRSEMTATPSTTLTAYLQVQSNTSSTIFSMQRLVAADSKHPRQPSLLQTQIIFYKK
jgi:hypothetical protein